MNRRQFVIGAGGVSLLAASGGLAIGSASHLPLQSPDLLTEIDGFIRDQFQHLDLAVADR